MVEIGLVFIGVLLKIKFEWLILVVDNFFIKLLIGIAVLNLVLIGVIFLELVWVNLNFFCLWILIIWLFVLKIGFLFMLF